MFRVTMVAVSAPFVADGLRQAKSAESGPEIMYNGWQNDTLPCDRQTSWWCQDPMTAVMKTLGCIESKDHVCATEGYNILRFKKYHNGIDTRTPAGFPIPGMKDMFWKMGLKFSTFKLTYDHMMFLGRNMVSVRYIEDVRMSDGTDFNLTARNTWPWNQTILQYEHAIVKVDNECRIMWWDQYGDNKEQTDVTDAVDEMMADQGVKCFMGLAFPWQC